MAERSIPGGGAGGTFALADCACCASVSGGAPGWPATLGTAGWAPVTRVAGGLAGVPGPVTAPAPSGALEAGADLQERVAAASSTAILRMRPLEGWKARILRRRGLPAALTRGVCLLQCAFSAW